MSLAPLLNAAPAIQLHAFAALAAFGLGAVQLAAPKGTLPHRTIGWIWVVLMVIVAATSFWIHDLRVWGPWSPIHLLAIFTLATLPLAVVHARRHRVDRHRNAMTAIFVGALVIAGLFTLMPGRMRWCSGTKAAPNRAQNEAEREGSARPSQLDDKSLNNHMKIAQTRGVFGWRRRDESAKDT
jgi:uncharacterized membrane protein